MKKTLDKLINMEKDLSEEKGKFRLFAFFLRENSPGVWDLVVSAAWIDKDKSKALKFIVNKVQKYLNKNEILQLSRIVIIDKNNSLKAIKTEHSIIEIKNSNFFGLQIKEAYIITSS